MLLFSSAYNEYTVISKEYTGPLDFDITGVDCILLIKDHKSSVPKYYFDTTILVLVFLYQRYYGESTGTFTPLSPF